MTASFRGLPAGMLALTLWSGHAAAQPAAPARPAPGKPPQIVLPGAPTVAGQQRSVKVPPGPEPWFTIFGTSEVVGYIEPCG